MPVAVALSLMAAVALTLQFSIFVYLYRSNRFRFFGYLVLAWGCYVGSKGFEAVRYLLPSVPGLGETSHALGIVGDFLILAGALASRWNYSIRPWHALLVVAYALYSARYGVVLKVPTATGGTGWILGGPVVVVAG